MRRRSFQGFVGPQLRWARSLRNDNPYRGVQIPAGAVCAREPAASQPQPSSTLGPRRHLEFHPAIERVDRYLVSKDCLPGRERQVDFEVVAQHPIARVREDPNAEIEISSRPAANTRASLASET